MCQDPIRKVGHCDKCWNSIIYYESLFLLNALVLKQILVHELPLSTIMFYASVAMFLEVKFSLVAVWVEKNSAQFLFRLVYV